MYTKKNLERLCKDKYLNRDKGWTVYRLIKAASTSQELYNELITRVFAHADASGRDTVLRALGHSVVHVELEKLLCYGREADLHEIYRVMQLTRLEIHNAYYSPPLPDSAHSPTPGPWETMTAKWISDQNTLRSEHNQKSIEIENAQAPTGRAPSSICDLSPLSMMRDSCEPTPDRLISDQNTLQPEHDKKRKRDHSDDGSDDYNSLNVGAGLSKMEHREKMAVRRQPKRSCKSTRAAQSAVPINERNLQQRKAAKPKATQRSTRSISKPTAINGNVRPRRIVRLRVRTELNSKK